MSSVDDLNMYNNKKRVTKRERIKKWIDAHKIPINELFGILKNFDKELFYTCTKEQFEEFLFYN